MDNISMVLSIAAVICWAALGIMNLTDKEFQPTKSDYWFAYGLALLGIIESLVNIFLK